MLHRITVQVGVTSDEHPGHQKSICVSNRIEDLDLERFAELVGRAIRSAVRSAALYDRYGWENGQLTESQRFMNDLETGDTPTWPEVKATYRLTSGSE